jgi:nucleoside-diphosphate-sugar epimerase
MRQPIIVVTGAGGFVGGHLVKALRERGAYVRGVDIKHPEFEDSAANEFILADLRDSAEARHALKGATEVYALAADMGGMGYIGTHHADILHNNTHINLNTLDAAIAAKVERYFFASSACVYPEHRQLTASVPALKESDAYPANPDTAYGWEKLYTEQLVTHYANAYGFTAHIARFHNIYGTHGTWQGGREKAPAALCRKVAIAKLTGNPVIDIWGDGEQTRSFCYVDDCVNGVLRLVESGYCAPLNIGSRRLVTINQLALLIARIAGVDGELNHIDGPTGVRGRNSDNTLIRQVLGWEPEVSLEDGLTRTYQWIEAQVREQMGVGV